MCSRGKKKEKGTAPLARPLAEEEVRADGEAPGQEQGEEQQARLEVTCQPEAVTFRDEGGRFNYLFAYVVLRVGAGGLPREVAQVADMDGRVAIDVELEYAEGGAVLRSQDAAGDAKKKKAEVLRLYGTAGRGPFKSGDPWFDCNTLQGALRFRILKLSRNHDGRQFRLRLRLRGVDDSVVRPVVTGAVSVLSKRKRLTAVARGPESTARREVEDQADKECSRLAERVRSGELLRADGPGGDLGDTRELREVFNMDRVEDGYPTYVVSDDHSTHTEDMSDNEEDSLLGLGVGAGASVSSSGSSRSHLSEQLRLKRERSSGGSGGSSGSVCSLGAAAVKKVRTPASKAMYRSAPLGKLGVIHESGSGAAQMGGDKHILKHILGQLTSLQHQLASYTKVVAVVRDENQCLRRQVERLERRLERRGSESSGDTEAIGSFINVDDSEATMAPPPPPPPPPPLAHKHKQQKPFGSQGSGSNMSNPAIMSKFNLTAAAVVAAAGPPLELPRSHSLAPSGEEEDLDAAAMDIAQLFNGPGAMARFAFTSTTTDLQQLASC